MSQVMESELDIRRTPEPRVELPQLLVVTHRVPFPPDKGDRIRSFNIIKFLSKHADVHLASLADEAIHPDARETLGRMCARLEMIPVTERVQRLRAGISLFRGRTATEGAFGEPALTGVLRTWMRSVRFHAALLSTSGLAGHVRTRDFHHLPIYIDLVDVDSEKWFAYARNSLLPKSLLYRLEGTRLRRLEGELADWAAGVMLVSESEAGLFRRVVRGDRPIHAVTNGVDLDYFRPVYTKIPRPWSCVFVGALDYKPNVDGISWFCRTVWPRVLKELPGATVAVVGRRPVARVRQLGQIAGVTVLGQVADVRPYLVDAALAIAPLTMARGVQNKVLEAMAMGKAVVASPEAIDGLGVRPNTDVICARSSEEWVSSIVGLLADPSHRERVSEAARTFAASRHQWDVTLSPLLDVLQIHRRERLRHEGNSPATH